MSIVFLGRAQMNAMRAIWRDMFPKMPVKFRAISEDWGSFDEAATRRDLADADLVVAQAEDDAAAVFKSDTLIEATSGDVIFMPYVHLDGLASLEASGGAGILGAEQVLDGQDGRRQADIFDDLCRGRIDMQNQARVDASLARMRASEATVCDLGISDYIAETYRIKPSFFGADHPAQHILFELFRRLCSEMALDFDQSMLDDPVFHGRHALPITQRAFTPVDVDRLELDYGCDPNWYKQTQKLLTQVLKSREQSKN